MFPQLKTTAVAQYPATRTIEFRTETLRFVDGTEQRYREWPGALRRWTIRLDALDETELSQVELFVESNHGRSGTFSFTDPWDGTVHANCSLASDDATLQWTGEMRGRTTLTIVENRG